MDNQPTTFIEVVVELDVGLRERVAPVVHRLLRHLAGSQGVVEDPDLVDQTVEVR